MTDFSQMSDDELMRLYQQAQQAENAQTGQPLPQTQQNTYAQLAAAGGLDTKAQPGTQRFPLAGVEGGQAQPGQYYVDQQGLVKREPDVEDRVRAVARGVPVLGAFADEANAALGATLAPITDPIYRAFGMDKNPDYIQPADDWSERYRQVMNAQALRDEGYDNARPTESMGLQLAGGLAGGAAMLPVLAPISSGLQPAAGLLPRVGAATAEGATVGGAHGYGSGYGDYDDPSRLRAAGGGALFGGGVGGAIPVGSRALGSIWGATGEKAINAVSPKRTVNPGASESAQVTVAQGDERSALNRLARALERDRVSPEEALSKAQGLGAQGMLLDVGESTRDLGRTASNTPSRASGILKEALDRRQAGVLKNGEFVEPPQSLRTTERLGEALGVAGRRAMPELESLTQSQKAAAGPAYAKFQSAPPVARAQVKEFIGPDFGRAYATARKISQREAAMSGGKPLPEKIPAKLDWRTLDLVKQGLDDLVSPKPLEGIGANEQRSLKDFRKAFVARLDELNPDYAPARQAFAGPAAVKNAIDDGQAFMRESPDVTAKAFAELSPSEQEGFRVGVYQAIRDRLGSKRPTNDAVSDLLTPTQLERFKAVFPGDKFGGFVKQLQDEQHMFGSRQAVLGNSTTARQLANMADADEPMDAIAAGLGLAQGSPGAFARLGDLLLRNSDRKMTEGGAEALAAILSSTDENVMREATKGVTEAQRRLAAQLAARNAQGATAGYIAGQQQRPQ